MSTAAKQPWLDYLLQTLGDEEFDSGTRMTCTALVVANINQSVRSGEQSWDAARMLLEQIGVTAVAGAAHKYRTQQLFAAILKYIENPDLIVDCK